MNTEVMSEKHKQKGSSLQLLSVARGQCCALPIVIPTVYPNSRYISGAFDQSRGSLGRVTTPASQLSQVL